MSTSKDDVNEGPQEYHAGVLAFFHSLPETGRACAHIFDRGDYYSVHGETARLAAATVFRTNAVIKKRGSGAQQVNTVFLNQSNFETFIRELLLVKQYRVIVYKQQSSNRNDWAEEVKASPGNLTQLEDVLFGGSQEQTNNAAIIAVKITSDGPNKTVGVGYVDVTARVLRVSQFTDTENFSNLEALIVQLGPKECLLPSGEAKARHGKCIERNGVLVTERKKTDFSTSDSIQDLSRLVRGWNAGAVAAKPELQRTLATAALSAALKYLELTSNEGNFGQFTFSVYDLKQFMRLDAAALKALHVETNDNCGAAVHNTTLLSVLDKCRSSAGRRMMAQWLRQPLLDINKIVVESSTLPGCRHMLGDFDLFCIALQQKSQPITNPSISLYQCTEALPELCEALARYEGEHSAALTAVFTAPLQESAADLSKFQEMIEATVDLDQVKQGVYVIKPDFDEELCGIRGQLDALENELSKSLRVAAADLSLEAGKSIKLEHNGQYGYFFRVTLKDEKCLRNNRAYTTLDTNKSGVRFRNSRMTDLSSEHTSQMKLYETQQKKVVHEILNIACGYVDVIQSLSSVLTTLDCICALASAAVSSLVPYVRPKMMPQGSGVLRLQQCRHPCLELQDGVSYIPNDTNMGDDAGRFHIITGPNMGGKSTYLRGVATAVLMAHVGSYVPCSEASIPIMDAILARVGAGDCQQKGVSTFMAEMLETSSILRTATRDSLIIVDELGRGTSTYDGFGLAWAISEHIARDIGSYCLFATHFHEVTALADVLPAHVRNFHMAAATDDKSLTLLYQVLRGACDRSFGIHCAKIAHFPPKVVEYAKRKAEELEEDFATFDADDSEEAVKKRKKEKSEGEELVKSTLTEAASWKLDSMTDDDFQTALANLKSKILAQDNAYVRHLLAAS
ncbi:DNA mismatch repair protein MutS C-terminal [Trinorchestia longiramus]|nr:DNA mismatch repair protein MutS C-terminal [Trinorchestia longiramus]